jgi:hypothetical protein
MKDFKFLDSEIYENKKKMQHNLEKFAPLMGVLNNTFKPTLLQKS